MRSTAAYAVQRMGKPSNIKDGRLGNGRSIVFQTKLRELLRMAENGVSSKEGKVPSNLGRDLQFNLELDVSEALTGLKAVQREAKEAVKALKELESVQMRKDITPEDIERVKELLKEAEVGEVDITVDVNPGFAGELANYSNEELIKELGERTGVTPIRIEPNHKANLRIPSVKQSFEITGPSTIFITE